MSTSSPHQAAGFSATTQPASSSLGMTTGISSVVLIAAYAASIKAAALGYILLVSYALLLIISGKTKVRAKRMLGTHVLFVGFAACGIAGQYTQLSLFAVETFRTLSWVSLAFVLSQMSGAAIDTVIRFARLVTISSLAFIFWQPDRLQGVYSHPNHLAYIAAFLIAWTAAYDGSGPRKSVTKVALLFLVILLSRSSNGLVCGFLALTPYLFRANRFRVSRALGVTTMASISLLTAMQWGLLSELTDKVMQAYDSDIVAKAYSENFGAEGSFAWRLSYWIAIFNRFSHEGAQALWFGVGPGYMGWGNYLYDFMIIDPHNEYLRILVERGAIGLTFFTYFICQLLRRGQFAMIVSGILLLQMLLGNPLVHLPTVIVFLMIVSIADRKEDARA